MPPCRSYTATLTIAGNTYKVDRPFALGSLLACTFCMPQVKVFKDTTLIGTVVQACSPSYLCTYEVDLFMGTEVSDVTRKMKIRRCGINGHTCCSVPTCGICCKELDFEIQDGSGQPRSDVFLKKKHVNWCVECCSAGDMYQFKLPSDKDEAAVFTAAIQFIDMLYFENPWSCSA
mmetsp:Transcript_6554/g.4925  ORF Transcript_6554/g.4925 Transcript_6554/m.4925 type:complete len:175 (-) Transcript_6554:37-561(-)